MTLSLCTIIQSHLWILIISLMARKNIEPSTILLNRLILLFVCFVSCGLVYVFLSAVTRSGSVSEFRNIGSTLDLVGEKNGGGCCRGIENLELWGSAVKWGSEFKFNTSQECCNSCKSMCTGKDGPCLCDTWVFCGNREACGSKFGEVRYSFLSTLTHVVTFNRF